ncbi:hypothetical protein [Bradyrhizobium sp. CCBAU 11357]|uniref:hypothetical protein n=1 Tax=Bradyrhizobium sp. CCBAU 11357 TaxID=1630808 RepID=UPI002304A481|nr:hypothetical protein [Bradyrhizobium sp. CCBAU 11357]MDA9498431.1 hypothetical protein [Bradyrhizobium sp. CCBAU 11357]
MTTVYTHPASRRDVLLSSGETMSRADAEALGYDIAPYTDLLKPNERIATRHSDHLDLAVLPPFGLTVTETTAKTMGFAITKDGAKRNALRSDASAAWRTAIFTSPEAQDRPTATAELVTSRGPESLSADQAISFLRGLPIETTDINTEETTMTNDDPRAARLAEIRSTMNAFNRNNGYKAKASRADASAVEPAKLKRLAEIRYSTLYTNGKGMTQEAKQIKLALDTHDKIGTPLVQALAQLGVDASTLIPRT